MSWKFWKASRFVPADKAPGPDGYTMGLFLHCWDLLKEDLVNTFQNFHSQEYFGKSLNATYIALIPKNVVQQN